MTHRSDTPALHPAAETPGRRRLPAAALRTAPTAAIAALGLAAAWRQRGSIDAGDWLAYAIVAALVLAAVAASGAAGAPTRRLAAGAAGLAGLAAWDAASLAWSPAPELARDEALLTALYAVVLLIPALSLRRLGDRVLATAVVVAALGGLAVATAVRLVGAASADAVYVVGRLDFPISYPNAQAAMFLVGLWPALALAARRELPVLVRGGALGAAASLAGGWALAQSKGGALGVAVSTVVVLAVSRQRLRLIPPVAIVTGLTGAAFLALTAPYRAVNGAELAAIHHAGKAELALAGAGVLAGLVYAWTDRRIVLPERTTKTIGYAALLGVVTAVAAGASTFYVTHRDPADFFAAKWRAFKHLPTREAGTSHLVSLGSNRYDFWRVSLDEFRRRPVAGIGSCGFRAAYLLHRRSPETPARAHSLELDALSETGIVGLVLLGLGLGLAVAAFARRARDDLVALGALGAAACWLTHASVDWTWSFPAVGLPLFALAGIAAARAGGRSLGKSRAIPLALGATALAVAGFGAPWLATRYVAAALAGRGNPEAELDRARSLDPLSTSPLLARWALAPAPAAGIAPLAQAVRMEPRSADLRYALGRQQLLAGRKAAARQTLRAALRLDPGDPAILALLAAAR